MTIVDFYKSLSKILENCREDRLTREAAEIKLSELLQEAKNNNIPINIDMNILDSSNLIKLDDERSYVETSYDSSYDSDQDSDSSY